jgi:hypothetical protein
LGYSPNTQPTVALWIALFGLACILSFFVISLPLILSMFAVPYKLWRVEKGFKDKISDDLSIILGPFFTGALWIFHFTFGKFRLYLLANIIMDFLLAYPICYILQKLKLFKLENFRPIHIFSTYVLYSVIIYSYQLFLENPKNKLKSWIY